MALLKQRYLAKCAECLCEPVGVVVRALDASAAAREPLRSLKVNGNDPRLFQARLSYMQLFALCQALESDTSVQELDVSYNFLDDAAAAAVAKLVHANTTITKINLRGNSITHAGVAQLKEALIESLSVTSLDLGHNPLGDEGVRLVAGALEACSTVEDLSLDSTGMGAKGLIALTLAAADHPSLRYLNLEGADAQSLQAITSLHLAKMLAANRSLKYLNLGKHVLRQEGLETLVKDGLLLNTTLVSLDLHSCQLSQDCGPLLAATLLGGSRSLVRLGLANNRLSDAGALAVAAALRESDSLVELDVASNRITDLGLHALAAHALESQKLSALTVRGNRYGRTMWQKLPVYTAPDVRAGNGALVVV